MSIIKHVTLQKIVAHDFRYDPRVYVCIYIYIHIHTHTHTHLYEEAYVYDKCHTDLERGEVVLAQKFNQEYHSNVND